MALCDDISYIERTLAGDVAAFSVLVERYQTMVFSLVVRIVRQRQDAEDIAQDIFVKAYLSLKNFRNEARFSTWLCRIAYTTAISHTRKQRPDRAGVEIETERHAECDDIHARNLHEERLQKLQQSLDKLPSEDAILISLHYQHGKSIDEIVSITDMSASNVKVRLHRARKKLYQEIKEDD